MNGKEQILEAAKKVIARYGIKDASVQAIADEAGMTKGGLYYHYKGKDYILFDLADQFLREAAAPFKQSLFTNADQEEMIKAMISGISKRFHNMEHNKLQFYLTHEAILEKGELNELVSKRFKGWVDMAEEAIHVTYGGDNFPLSRALAATLIAAINGQATQLLLEADWVDIDELIKFWKVLFSVGIPSVLEYLQGEPDR